MATPPTVYFVVKVRGCDHRISPERPCHTHMDFKNHHTTLDILYHTLKSLSSTNFKEFRETVR